MLRRVLSFGIAFLLGVSVYAFSDSTGVSADLFKNLRPRNIGPANMGGRITDVEGVPGNPGTVYVGTATGGLWKTTNWGIRWTPLFDEQETTSIGDIALDPQNPDVIWVGTGEANPRNSVSIGCGVYKSTDGGKTWQYLGLRETRQISRIIVHPRDPNTVWVAALGSLFGPNPERGVFMTTDGGKTWQKVLYIDEQHGASDLDIDPVNPNILYAGMWRFERKPWTHTSGSEQGGVFKSTDGGRTWRKLTNGLPKLMGRIGVKVAPSNPNIVYVIAESNDGTLFRSTDRGETFQRISSETNIISRGFYYTDLRVCPSDPNRLYFLATQLRASIDGGRTTYQMAQTVHVDHHALWIDPTNPNVLWNGNDGGLAFSLNRGEDWDVVANIPLGQFYQIYCSFEAPFYQVAGGLQDNGSWMGWARNKEGGIVNEHWRMVSFGDGFYCLIHPRNPSLIISESQGGNILRTNLATGVQENISPQARRSDGGPASELKYRFNWNTPIIPSPHDPDTVYIGGNVVFKSTDFGTTWSVISPDLTTNDPEKQKDAGGPVWVENTTAEYHCTIISLAESPVQQGLLWVGTDDGRLWKSPDDGKTWIELTQNVPNLPPNSPVSHVEPSRAGANIAYVAFDRHLLNDFKPYLYKTTDGGKTWQPLTNGLPDEAYVFVVREDPRNLNLLYAGTERGLFVSFDGGQNWQRMPNLPPVPVHDIMVHADERPRDWHARAQHLCAGRHHPAAGGLACCAGEACAPVQPACCVAALQPYDALRARRPPDGRAEPALRRNDYLLPQGEAQRGTRAYPDSRFAGQLAARADARAPRARHSPHRVGFAHARRSRRNRRREPNAPAEHGTTGTAGASWNLPREADCGRVRDGAAADREGRACAGAVPNEHEGGTPVRAGDAGHDSPAEPRDAGADQRRGPAEQSASGCPPAELQAARRPRQSHRRPPEADWRAKSEGG
jgi:photosystem II stability/assembly factor-like uncharacterized protein